MNALDILLIGFLVSGVLIGFMIYESSSQRQRKAREAARRMHPGRT